MIEYNKAMKMSAAVGQMLIEHRRSIGIALGVSDGIVLDMLAQHRRGVPLTARWAIPMFEALDAAEKLRQQFSDDFVPLIGPAPVEEEFVNALGSKLRRVDSVPELIEHLTNVESQASLERQIARPDVTAAIVYQNLQMDSSQHGHIVVLVVGPGCTYKTISSAAVGRLGDVPSRFLYAVAYYKKEN